MAIAEVALAARFNRPGHPIVDHYTHVLASDGDLEKNFWTREIATELQGIKKLIAKDHEV
jgi:transketolase